MIGFLRRIFVGPPPVPPRIEPDIARPAPGIDPTPRAIVDDDIPDVMPGARLGYRDAAMRFVLWLQRNGETGEIPRGRLLRLYARHCDEEGLAWLSDVMLFAELARIAPRSERRITPVRGGKRKRLTTYAIPEVSFERRERRA